jgi:CRISPR/Cas system CSM-associated protein Csm2 small subunit
MTTETEPVKEEPVVEPVETPVVEQPEVEQEANVEQEEVKEQHVPLSALQKERRKRQEIEQELRTLREERVSKPSEPDDAQYEAATKADLGKARQQIIRDVQENTWIKENPERANEVNEKLAEFLKQRPNLAAAIEGATNRYEEAWELMDKLTPKQKSALKTATVTKKDTPGSPGSVPKAAALNQAVDVMSMTDAEFEAYRTSKRQRR